MASGMGTGSTLMMRIREGAQRMKAASLLGLDRPAGVSQTNVQPFAGTSAVSADSQIRPNQPPQEGAIAPPNRERMLQETEKFLGGVGPVSIGRTPDPSNQNGQARIVL